MLDKNIRIVIGIFLFVFILNSIATADIVHLKNGGVIKGTVVKDDETAVSIDIGGGTVVHNKKDVTQIVKEKVEPAPVASEAVPSRLMVNYVKRARAVEEKHIEAPKPKARLIEISDYVTNGIKSILRFDFLKRSK